MKELLLIAIGSALVNNVVLSQFLGLCPFLGVSKKVETSAGMGAAVIFVITIASAVTSLIYTGVLETLHLEVSADHRIYPGDRGFGTVCGNVLKEVHAFPLRGFRRVSSSDHYQLCGIRRGPDQCSEIL